MLKRFADFPVQIDVLSRFRSPKQQRETLQKAANIILAVCAEEEKQ